MKIENIKIELIKPYEKNPRINDGSVEKVANSIKEFVFKVPIIIDKDNVIICGHTRLKAAESLGMKEVPCIRADDLTPEQAKAFRLADNKVSEFSSWDYELLEFEMEDLDFDMSQFGFTERTDDDFAEPSEKEFQDKRLEHVCPECGFSWSD